MANEYCPTRKVNNYGASIPKEKLNLWKTMSGSNASGNKVNEICNIHKKPEEKPVEEKKENTVKNNTTSNKTNNTNSSPNENATNTNPTPEQNTTPNGTTP